MLSDTENEGVVRCQTGTLRLNDVEIMTLGVRCRMAGEEGVRWILASVGYGKS
jgi:hypothetical protein